MARQQPIALAICWDVNDISVFFTIRGLDNALEAHGLTPSDLLFTNSEAADLAYAPYSDREGMRHALKQFKERAEDNLFIINPLGGKVYNIVRASLHDKPNL